ncbi:hypothetical protein M569_06358 [Genlisea aurea]|uniref:Uncharacterized protein n=1 Tax=Genlisea aurea TaxID=192259 RepID=S8CNX6_9LAMI|nr:hypothetical protein M569_06358 [Genlisea aurea]
MGDYGFFEAPSFSLGIDLDDVTGSQPCPGPNSTPRCDGIASEEDGGGFEPYIRHSGSPQTFKRLRRGSKIRPSYESTDEGSRQPGDAEDEEIEDFSEEEDMRPGVPPTNSVCSSSKPSLRLHRAVISEFRNRWELKKGKEASSASAPTNIQRHDSNLTIPLSSASPLRKFQLIDSDSDDPSEIEGRRSSRAPYMILSPDEKQKNGDPWNELCSGKSSHIPTPVFDEVCDEYFKNAEHQSRAKVDWKDSNIGISRPMDSAPSALSYFFHKDSRIQKLVRDRLPYFFPLGAAKGNEHVQPNITGLDSRAHFEEVPSIMKKNKKRSRNKPVSQESDIWVDPKSGGTVPKNAGNRRVQAASKSTGHWYTNSDGRKVYVSSNGQELTGQIAYKQYKKENRIGFKGSKKSKASAAKRKSTPKKR